MQKNKLLVLNLFAIFILPTILLCNTIPEIGVSAVAYEPISTFNPVVKVDASFDRNNNKIHDHLEATLWKIDDEEITIVVTFDQPVTDALVQNIEHLGGSVISKWSLIYGAAVQIKANRIPYLAQLDMVNFIEENYECHTLLSTSVPQINVRPYVWDTLGFEGSSSHAIAILDTGIDDTHPDFTGRITHWQDFIGASASSSGDEYPTPTDREGHGTHCASIAAGSGAAAGTATTVEVSGTLGIPYTIPARQGYVVHVEVESSGVVTIDVTWDERPGPSSNTDTIMIIVDTNRDGVFSTSSDSFITGDYINRPITLTTGTLSPGKYPVLIGSWEGEIDRAAVCYTFTRPASSTSDGNNKYRGVAPGCSIVALKVLDDRGVGTNTELLNALNWILANELTYNIQVVSMSLGFDSIVSSIDSAVNNLVSQGYICVAAAGNDFMDGDTIKSPGTALKAITVGAIDDVDKMAIYSSNGASGSGKPDVVAPGGAYRYFSSSTNEDTHPIIAADTNDGDHVEISTSSPNDYWESEFNADDYAAHQGTSMATPHVAGLVALIIQAMGTDWVHTEAAALRVKNYICGTATEVNDGERSSTFYNSPALNRGDADLVEGFGKVHGDAAIEAFLEEYVQGTEVTDTLSSSPSGKQSWARRVDLVSGMEFKAGIEMDGTADYDLYLYNPEQDMSSYLGYLKKSTTASLGAPENIAYTPSSDMTAYIVIKRVSGYGNFTIMAEATSSGTIPFTFPWGLPIFAWVIVGILGLTSVVLIIKKRR